MNRLVVLAVVLGGTFAHAQRYKRTTTDAGSLCVAWAHRDFTYRLDAAGSLRTPGHTEIEAIEASFASWQAVSDTCSDFRFIRGADIERPKVGANSASTNVLTFREVDCGDVVPSQDPCLDDGSCATEYGCWDHKLGTIALTTVHYDSKTAVISDADIEFNSATFLFTTVDSPPCQFGKEKPDCVAYDLQNTATHEIGHVVGLDHVLAPTSTMEEDATTGETGKRVIDPGTALGFCLTYPKGEPPTPCDEFQQVKTKVLGQTVGSFGCNCTDTSAGALALTMGPLGLLLRRRNRIH